MPITVTHAKTNTIPDWTQADLDTQIALGNYPPGTLLADIVLPGDWNEAHTVEGLGSFSVTTANTDLTTAQDRNEYCNKGASAVTEFTIKSTAAAGTVYNFLVGQDTNGIKVIAEGRTISISGFTSALDGYIQSLNKADSARAVVIDANEIFITTNGNWEIA
jgi:hypothetical protein